MADVQEQLRQLVRDSNLTRAHFAELLDMNPVSFRQWLNPPRGREVNLGAERAEKLANAFGRTVQLVALSAKARRPPAR